MSVPAQVLVANRGEIAVRIIHACRAEGVRSVAALARPDLDSLPARLADKTVCLEGSGLAQTYLSVPQIIGAALASGCDAVHPGYGFLSERPALAEACEAHGISFVGPTSAAIRLGGDKVRARELAESLGIPVGSGSTGVETVADAIASAEAAGYPVLLKAAAGGGGRGMVLVSAAAEMSERFDRASEEARNAFGDGRLFVEHYVTNARHVEIQILADRHGNVIHLGDRDCSYQRRYQKLIEEAPASSISPGLRTELAEAALRLAKALDYVGAGTVEFVVDQDRCTFCFLEINTRVQVEHPVTEMVTGVDIVREQLRIAGGSRLSVTQDEVEIRGHAIECRVNAESARQGFVPAPGRLTDWVVPGGTGVRVDTHCFAGYEIPPFYDSLIAKVIVHGVDRAAAASRLAVALDDFRVGGIETTLDFHRAVVADPAFLNNEINTRWVEEQFLPAWS